MGGLFEDRQRSSRFRCRCSDRRLPAGQLRHSDLHLRHDCTREEVCKRQGEPKGVMCSHDGCMCQAANIRYYLQLNDEDRFVSFLPMNHIAAQYADTMVPVRNRITMYMARPDALRGSLVQTLQKARPTFFVAVPRVFEKFMEAIRAKNAQASVGMEGNCEVVREAAADQVVRVHRVLRVPHAAVRTDLHAAVLLLAGQAPGVRQGQGDAGAGQVRAALLLDS